MNWLKRYLDYALPHYVYALVAGIGGGVAGKWPLAVGFAAPLVWTPVALLLFFGKEWDDRRKARSRNLAS
jgi:hypothetical protein